MGIVPIQNISLIALRVVSALVPPSRLKRELSTRLRGRHYELLIDRYVTIAVNEVRQDANIPPTMFVIQELSSFKRNN